MSAVIDKPSLLSRLQSAPEGSRELSDEVLYELGWRGQACAYWSTPGNKMWVEKESRPDPSRNLKDAVSLVPEGWRYLMDKRPYAESRVDGYRAEVYRQGSPETPEAHWGPTMPLALCIAIIKAHEAEKAA